MRAHFGIERRARSPPHWCETGQYLVGQQGGFRLRLQFDVHLKNPIRWKRGNALTARQFGPEALRVVVEAFDETYKRNENRDVEAFKRAAIHAMVKQYKSVPNWALEISE
jgi:hypothetical protein